MAIWQYTFHVIPPNSILNNLLNPQLNEDGLIDYDIYWSRVPTGVDFFDELGNILILSKSWSSDLRLFGVDASNCFEIYSEHEQVKSVSFRVNFTSDYEEILRMVLEFIQLKGLLLVDEKHNVVEPNYLVAKELIEQSIQYNKYNKLKFR